MKKGFTLKELTIVMAILGVFFAMLAAAVDGKSAKADCKYYIMTELGSSVYAETIEISDGILTVVTVDGETVLVPLTNIMRIEEQK